MSERTYCPFDCETREAMRNCSWCAATNACAKPVALCTGGSVTSVCYVWPEGVPRNLGEWAYRQGVRMLGPDWDKDEDLDEVSDEAVREYFANADFDSDG